MARDQTFLAGVPRGPGCQKAGGCARTRSISLPASVPTLTHFPRIDWLSRRRPLSNDFAGLPSPSGFSHPRPFPLSPFQTATPLTTIAIPPDSVCLHRGRRRQAVSGRPSVVYRAWTTDRPVQSRSCCSNLHFLVQPDTRPAEESRPPWPESLSPIQSHLRRGRYLRILLPRAVAIVYFFFFFL